MSNKKNKRPPDTEAIRRGMLILDMLRTDTSLTIKNIHNNLENIGIYVSQKSVERSMNALETTFPNYVKVIGSMPRGYRRHIHNVKASLMNPSEALCLELANDYLSPLLPNKTLKPIEPYLKEAKQVLGESQNQKVKNWKSKVIAKHEGINLKPANIKAKILDTAHEAIFNGKKIEVKYLSKNSSETKTHVLNPGGLVHRGRISYLVCSFEKYPKDISYLAMHRFKSMLLLESDSVLKNKNIKSLVKGVLGFNIGEKIKIKLKFSQFAGSHLFETPLSPSQQLKNNKGFLVLEAEVENNMDLRFWIRAFGDEVEVLRPLSLRKEFQDISNRMNKIYERN